jgi:hypothetical protein
LYVQLIECVYLYILYTYSFPNGTPYSIVFIWLRQNLPITLYVFLSLPSWVHLLARCRRRMIRLAVVQDPCGLTSCRPRASGSPPFVAVICSPPLRCPSAFASGWHAHPETVRALARPSLRSYPGPSGFGRLDLATVRPLLSDSVMFCFVLLLSSEGLLCSGLLSFLLLAAPIVCCGLVYFLNSIHVSNQILFYTSQFVHAMRVDKFILHITVP